MLIYVMWPIGLVYPIIVIADILYSFGQATGSLLVHLFFRHAFFFPLGPLKHFKSRHSGHLPQFDCLQLIHWPQRLLERFRLELAV